MADRFVNSAAVGAGNGLTKVDAYTTIVAALAAEPDGQRYLVSHTHVEGAAGTLTIACSADVTTPDEIISVDFGDDSYTPGAMFNNADNFAFNVQGHVRMSGIEIHCGAGIGNFLNDMTLGSTAAMQIYIDCHFHMDTTSSAAHMSTGGGAGSFVIWINCTYEQTGPLPTWYGTNRFEWRGGSVLSSSAEPSIALIIGLAQYSEISLHGVDLTELGDFNVIQGQTTLGSVEVLLDRCRLAASWSGNINESVNWEAGDRVRLINTGSEDINHGYKEESGAGAIDHEIELYAAGVSGIKHNTVLVPVSYKMVSSANCSSLTRWLKSPKLVFPNESTVSQTAQIEFIHNHLTNLTNKQVFGEWGYLATSGQQIETLITDSFDSQHGAYDPFATPVDQETSLKDWTEGMTERGDSTVYSADQKVKQNLTAMAVFICTVGGTTAASPPAGFLNASDGDTIVDGTVTWKVMRRQKASVVITAAEQGLVTGRLIIADPNITLYMDSRLT